MKISTNEAISAIYYALWQGGYEYAHLERSEAHMAALAAFSTEQQHPYFAKTRQNTCEVYPYWPRAALLELASFHVQDGALTAYDGLKRKILSAPNLAAHERDADLFAWLEDFPAALQEIKHSADFRRYMAWERTWRDGEKLRQQENLQRIASAVEALQCRYALPVGEVQLLISPIKCVYSADYHLLGERFVFSSGRLRAESVIHELLHMVVHPLVEALPKLEKRIYPGVDASYYAAGQVNAFEEYAVRQLTQLAMQDALPLDLAGYVLQLAENNRKTCLLPKSVV